ncbi:potassium channel family protein [Streptomyces sp. NPDC058625]|uniref:potassium channel family protein n=1 Tax=Streptomyces sp. NPDC058625 TaxID=3346564 RepID=UPI00365CE852
MTTVTTVGYGDLYPTTTEGRLIAVALMVGGIALAGPVTATLASWFMDRFSELRTPHQRGPDDQRDLRPHGRGPPPPRGTARPTPHRPVRFRGRAAHRWSERPRDHVRQRPRPGHRHHGRHPRHVRDPRPLPPRVARPPRARHPAATIRPPAVRASGPSLSAPSRGSQGDLGGTGPGHGRLVRFPDHSADDFMSTCWHCKGVESTDDLRAWRSPWWTGGCRVRAVLPGASAYSSVHRRERRRALEAPASTAEGAHRIRLPTRRHRGRGSCGGVGRR